MSTASPRPALSLVFPVFDEEQNIGRLLDESLRLAPVLALALLLLAGLYAASPGVHARFERIVASLTGKSKHTDWQRVFLWQGVVDTIQRNPVLGVGPGEFKHEMNRQVQKYQHAVIQSGVSKCPHSFSIPSLRSNARKPIRRLLFQSRKQNGENSQRL